MKRKLRVLKNEKMLFKKMKNKPVTEVIKAHKKIFAVHRSKSGIKSAFYRYRGK